MGRIHVLGDALINRIAAGEVVERPASVVKELVENSLDAGARTVRVSVEAGGRRRIRVIDDGCGMDRDDALLALERHATSKVRQAEDLASIATLGFRGEALSSIAAVSVFQLSTATRDGHGTTIVARGGRIESVKDAGLPRGTEIDARRLFFNMPARRKFLRSEATELSHVVRWISRYSLAHPGVRFELDQEGRRLLFTPAVDDRRQRIVQVYGDELASKLLPFSGVDGEVAVSGFAGRPVDGVGRRDHQHLFVNGRAVQDRVLLHAIGEAYGNTMPRGRYTSAFLFVELDPAAVDVNVHPQKTEVRFHQSSQVHDLVRESVARALSAARVVPSYSELRPAAAATALGALGGPENLADRGATDRREAPAARAGGPCHEPVDAGTPLGARPAMPAGRVADSADPSSAPARLPAFQQRTLDDVGGGYDQAPEHPALPLTQFLESYIVAQDADGLVIIDQHAAHERVLFEKYLAEADRNAVEVQRLLFPLVFELAPHEAVLLEEELDEFRRLGFLVEPFGGSTVRLDGVPAVGAKLDPEAFLRELIGEAREARSAASSVPDLRRKLVTSAACQAAIKVNYPLTKGTMQALLDDLYKAEKPSTCPHGRPALFRLSLEEIERTFKRR